MKRLIITEEEKISIKGLYEQKALLNILKGLGKNLGLGVEKKVGLGVSKQIAKSPTKIKLKPVLGLGKEHIVYESATFPNKIIKVELTPGTINKWYTIFNNRPDIFPKIYKTIQLVDKEGIKLTGVVMEKLNTSKFTKLWYEIESEMYLFYKNSPTLDKEGSLEGIVKYIKEPKVKKQWEELLIYVKKEKPELSKSIDEFSKMVNELYKIKTNPDIRKYNFGYDNNGVLKCLDI